MPGCRDREQLCRFGVAVPEPELIHHARSPGPADPMGLPPPPLSPALPQTHASTCPGTVCAEEHGEEARLQAGILVGAIPHSRESVSAQGPPQVPQNQQLTKHSTGMSRFAPARRACQCPGARSGLAQRCRSPASSRRQTAMVCVCVAQVPGSIGPRNSVSP